MTRWLLTLAGLAALAGAGCIKMDQEVTLNADGSADVKTHYAMGEQAIAQLEAMKKMSEQNPDMKVASKGPDLVFDEAKIKAEFEKNQAAGVELKSCKVETKEGWKHAYLEAHCKDLAAAAKGTGSASQGGFSLTKNAEGNYVLEMAGKDKAAGAGARKNLSPEQKAQQDVLMKTMMAGLRIEIKLNVPGDVLETTATSKDKRTATWLLDINDEKFSEKSEALGEKGIKVTFSGKGLDLKEFKSAPPAAEPAKDAEPK